MDTRAARAEILIVGTYPMANPGQDLSRFELKNTLSPERQAEIRTLEWRLSQFEPTKVAVEALPFGRLSERYCGYISGKIPLDSSEVEQVGFRMAQAMGHDEIYGIDHLTGTDLSRLVAFANAERQDWFLEMLAKLPREIGRRMEDMDRRFTVSQILAIHNTPEALMFFHSLYIEMLRLSARNQYPGAEVAADWYKRNMILYANIRRVAESRHDRVLVIISAGHAKLLRQFVEEATDLDLVDPLDYLPDVPNFKLG